MLLTSSTRLSSGFGRTFCFQVAKNTGVSGSRFRSFIASGSLSSSCAFKGLSHGVCHCFRAVYCALWLRRLQRYRSSDETIPKSLRTASVQLLHLGRLGCANWIFRPLLESTDCNGSGHAQDENVHSRLRLAQLGMRKCKFCTSTALVGFPLKSCVPPRFHSP